MTCPFKTMMSLNDNKDDNINKCPYSNELSNLSTSRTIEYSRRHEMKNEIMENRNKHIEDELSDDEDSPKGGCPVFTRPKRDPINKHYEFFYEIKYHKEKDFLFSFQGGLNKKEFTEKTKILNSYPKHLKYTLFQNHNTVKLIRKKEFPEAFFAFNEIKEKANKSFKNKNYKEAIDYYYLAYSTLKWLEFSDDQKKEKIITEFAMENILDSDVILKTVHIDDENTSKLFESFDACLVYLLMNLSSAYMELRHYKEALDCMDECVSICGEKIPDIFFRRSQARTYNKFSNYEDLNLALQDVEKARSLKDSEIYEEHYKIVTSLIADKKACEKNKIESIYNDYRDLISQAKYFVEKINKNKLNVDEVLFDGNYDSYEMQSKILEEMKTNYESAVKFYTESNDKHQLELAYKEIENFLITYNNYRSYYNLELSTKNEVFNHLSEENKKLCEDPYIIRYVKYQKNRKSEEIFAEGKFNFQLFQYCLNKVSSEFKKLSEINTRSVQKYNSKSTSTTPYYMLYLGIFIFSIAIMFFTRYYTISFPKIRNE